MNKKELYALSVSRGKAKCIKCGKNNFIFDGQFKTCLHCGYKIKYVVDGKYWKPRWNLSYLR